MTTTTTDRRQGLSGNLAFKKPCKAATTANITLSGEQTIDGISCVDGDRVLVWNQTTASENGIYDVSTGDWTRSLDFDGTYDAVRGTLVFVNQGTSYGNSTFQVTTSDTFVIGTDSLAFAQVGLSGAASVTSIAVSSNASVVGTFASSGAATFSSSMIVAGAVTLSSNLLVVGTLTSCGVATFDSSAAFAKGVAISSALAVTGAATFSASAAITGTLALSSQFTVAGGASISSALTVAGAATVTGAVSGSTGASWFTGSSAPANGSSNFGIKVTNTSGLGIFFGSSAPTLTAAQGSLYLRTEGASSLTRLYVQSSGSSNTWVGILSSA